MSTTSPNMGLVVPAVGVDPFPTWALDINADLSILDGHNHSSGMGVQIQPNGININSDLSFQINNAISLRSSRYSAQSVALTAPADVGCVYVVGNELYYNDVTGGHQIAITANGSVNAGAGSISGLPSGTASATFSAGTFVWQSATSTAANMDAGSYILRNAGAGSKGLTLQPPAAMAADIIQTLPTIPGSLSLMAMDASGNMSAPYSISGGLSGSVISPGSITATQIASGTITTTQIAASTIAQSNLAIRSTGTTVGAGGIAISSSSGSFTTNSATFVSVTNLSVTITTLGSPVALMLSSAATASPGAFVGQVGIDPMELKFLRDGATTVGVFLLEQITGGSACPVIPPGAFSAVDVVTAGTHTYVVQVRTPTTQTTDVSQCVLIAYEL